MSDEPETTPTPAPEPPAPEPKKATCPDCGMEQEATAARCAKCDYPLYAHRLDDDLERVKKKKTPPPQGEPPTPPAPPSKKRGAFSIIPGGPI